MLNFLLGVPLRITDFFIISNASKVTASHCAIVSLNKPTFEIKISVIFDFKSIETKLDDSSSGRLTTLVGTRSFECYLISHKPPSSSASLIKHLFAIMSFFRSHCAALLGARNDLEGACRLYCLPLTRPVSRSHEVFMPAVIGFTFQMFYFYLKNKGLHILRFEGYMPLIPD